MSTKQMDDKAFIIMALVWFFTYLALCYVSLVELPRAEIKAYGEGHDSCMEWYRIDPYENERGQMEGIWL